MNQKAKLSQAIKTFDFGYIKNKENNSFVFLMCKHHQLCDESEKKV